MLFKIKKSGQEGAVLVMHFKGVLKSTDPKIGDLLYCFAMTYLMHTIFYEVQCPSKW